MRKVTFGKSVPGAVTPNTRGLYTMFDKEKNEWRLRTREELNGILPKKDPHRKFRRDFRDIIIIEVGQLWMELTSRLVVVVVGAYPTSGTLIFAPYRDTTLRQPPMFTRDFVMRFTPWDYVPD